MLAAHQHKTAARGQLFDPIEPRDEERVRGHLLVIGWSAASGGVPQFYAHKLVFDPGSVEPGFQSGATEVWEAGRGRGPNIGERSNLDCC